MHLNCSGQGKLTMTFEPSLQAFCLRTVLHLYSEKDRWVAQQGIRVSRILIFSGLRLGLPSLVFPVISFPWPASLALLFRFSGLRLWLPSLVFPVIIFAWPASLASLFRFSPSEIAYAARLQLFRWLPAPPPAFFPIQSSSICCAPLIIIL